MIVGFLEYRQLYFGLGQEDFVGLCACVYLHVRFFFSLYVSVTYTNIY